MRRVEADISNTMTSEPVGIMKLPSRWNEEQVSPFQDGECVILHEPGLEIEAIVYRDETGWLATPIDGTWRDLEGEGGDEADLDEQA